MICYPNAKINLGLKILSKRQDGFHNINSFFLPIPLFDVLEVKKDISLKTNKISYSGIPIPIEGKNLVLKAYDILQNDFNLSPLRIHLHKSIPIGSGLGGGSSNATFMLNILNCLFNLELTKTELFNYARALGSDCPFFLSNTLSNVLGVGDQITPHDYCFKNYFIVIIKPNIYCSTKKIFSKYKLIKPNSTILSLNEDMLSWNENLVNDLEIITFSLYPELREIKEYLYSLGALYASMSGSGSAIYGIFNFQPKTRREFDGFTWSAQLS